MFVCKEEVYLAIYFKETSIPQTEKGEAEN